MSAITAKASRKMKKYAVLTREPRCFLGSFDFSWEQRKWINTVDISTNMVDPKSGKYDLLPHVAPGNIESFTGRLYDNVKLVGEENLISGKFVFNVGDIVYGKINPQLGKYVFARFSGLTSADAYVLNAKNGIVQKFLYAVIQTRDFYDYSVSVSKRSGMPKINRDELNAYSYWAPSESEQLKIGEYLLTLDHLITLHQRKCVFLFGFFQAFISMIFTASTFSWEQRKLGELALFNPKDELPQTFEYVDLESVVGTEMLSHRTEVKSSAPSRAQRLAHTGDLFYQTVRPYQKNNYLFEKPDNNYVFSTGYAQMRPYVDGYFLLSLVQSERFVKVVLDNCTGTSYPAINANDLAEIEVAAPSDESEAQRIGTIFRSIDNLITLHQRECISFTARAGRLILTANKKRNTSSWEQRKLGELVDRVVRKNTNNESTLPLTISAQYGLVDQITYFNNRVASRDVSNYYLVMNGEFAYNKSTSDGYPFGAVKRLDLYEKGVLSTLYIVFAPKKEQQIDSDYLTVFFDTDRWHKGVAERAAEGARNHGLLNISAEDFFDIDLSVPKDIVEQKQIGAFIRQLDTLITLHQRKPFLMKWRTSDANRNQTNRLVL